MVLYVTEQGIRRRAKKFKCQVCNKDFLGRANSKRKYCSKSCANAHTDKTPNVQCATCGKRFFKSVAKQLNSRSGLFFCDKECKSKAQRLDGIKEIHPTHYGTGFGKFSYRDKFTEKELVCRRCGYDEFSCGIDIHHKDKNRTNNSKNNLIPLCACCHRGLHNNQWLLDTKI